MAGWKLFPGEPGLKTAGQALPGDIHISEGGVTHSRFAGLFQNYVVSFKSMISGIEASFPAVLTSFDDGWSSNWDSQDIYGRMDQVHNFKNTTRTISFAFDVVPDDAYQSAQQMAAFEQLTRMLYPTYEIAPDESATEYQAMSVDLIRQAPIIGIKMGNLIRSNDAGSYLLGKVAGFNFAPDIDMGFWLSRNMTNSQLNADENFPAPDPLVTADGAQYFPKKFSVNVEFTVMHTEPLAQNSGGGWAGIMNYPYNAQQTTDAFSDAEKAEVIIESAQSFVQAKIPKKTKKSLGQKILDAMFKP